MDAKRVADAKLAADVSRAVAANLHADAALAATVANLPARSSTAVVIRIFRYASVLAVAAIAAAKPLVAAAAAMPATWVADVSRAVAVGEVAAANPLVAVAATAGVVVAWEAWGLAPAAAKSSAFCAAPSPAVAAAGKSTGASGITIRHAATILAIVTAIGSARAVTARRTTIPTAKAATKADMPAAPLPAAGTRVRIP